MTTDADQREKPLNASKLIMLFALPVFVLWFANLVIPFISAITPAGYVPPAVAKAYSQAQLARTGTFGDTFGAVNSLFSGLALAGVAVAVIFQRRELRHQEEQTAIAKEQLAMASQQSKEADDERKRAERYAALTAALNAASSLAQAASQSIQFTLATSQQRIQFNDGGGITREEVSHSRNTGAERKFRKYIQMQDMFLFEIQNFDAFYGEGRGILSLQTKKDYLESTIKSVMDDWRQLLIERVALNRNAQQPQNKPDENLAGRYEVMKQANDQLNSVSLEIAAFLSQDGLQATSLYNFVKSNVRPFEKVRYEFLTVNNEDDEAVYLLFHKALNCMAQFDVSYVML
jgi:hypothetical protein